MDTLFNDLVTTRKPHKCFGCEIVYPAGTRMRRCVIKDGELFTTYHCPVCNEVSRDWDDGDWLCISAGETRSGDERLWNGIRDKQAADKEPTDA